MNSSVLSQTEVVEFIARLSWGVGKYILYGIIAFLLILFIKKKASVWFTGYMMRKKDHRPFNKGTMVFLEGKWWWLEENVGEYVIFARRNPDYKKAVEANVDSEKPLIHLQIPIEKYQGRLIVYK